MTEKEYYQKTDECIARFKNGRERYKTSALFSAVVKMLVRDVGPYDIIEYLIQMNEDNVKAFEEYVLRDTRPMVSIYQNHYGN